MRSLAASWRARAGSRWLGLPGLHRLAWPLARLRAALEAEWQRLPLWLPVALGIGIILYFLQGAEPGPGWRLLPGPLLLAALLLSRRRPLLAWGVALLGMAALGFAVAGWHAARRPPPLVLPSRAVVLEGPVAAVEHLPQGLRITLRGARMAEAPPGPDDAPLARDLRIRLRAKDPLLPRPGDRLRLRALVRPPAPPAYPGAWDFQRNAFFDRLGGSGFAIGPAELLEALDPEPEPPPFAAARAEIEARVGAALPGAVGAISAALLTGGQSAIPAPALQAMRDSGLAHLLSVSGLHIAIVMGLGFAILRYAVALVPPLALRFDSKCIAAPGGLLLGGCYLLLTGAQVPMQRSFAMAVLVTLGILVGRRALSLRALALAAAAVMLLQPAALLGASFQMSFAAVLVLIAGAEAGGPLLARWRRGPPKWWRQPLLLLAGMVLTSVLAGLATTPYGLHHFGRLQVYGVAANMVAVPITSFLVMPAGMAAVALMPFGLEGWALAAMGWGVQGILLVADAVAAWPGAALLAPPIPAWGLALTTAGLLWLCLWQRRWRLLGLPAIALGLCSAAWVVPPDLLVSGDGRLIALRTPQVAFLQQNSGASALVRESWLRVWGLADAEPLPAGRRDGLDCNAAACRFQPDPAGTTALLLRAQPPARRGDAAPAVQAAPFCGQAVLLVSAEPIRGRCRGTAMLDRFSVWRDGPHAVWLGGEAPLVLSDRAARGDRPWVPPPPVPRSASMTGEARGAAPGPGRGDSIPPDPAISLE
jgi:competence protein ComEC